jgi:uncharacterized protein
MITPEYYYSIMDYSRAQFEQDRVLAKCREQMTDLDFLDSSHACIIGEKGVGKTVLARQKVLSLVDGDLAKVLYVSLDDTLFAGQTMFEIAKAADQRGVKFVIFDEVHRYPLWKTNLKMIIDRLKIKTVASGSSILSFSELGGLSRRSVKFELLGLSFREYINLLYPLEVSGVSLEQLVKDKEKLKSIQVTVESATQKPMKALFEDYLQRGYYTYALQERNLKAFLGTLRQATEDTISFEIVTAQTHSRPDMSRKLQALFKAIAQTVPCTVDYTFLQEYAQIADLRTVKHYLACLQNAGIIHALDRKTLKSLRKPEKLYLGNTCLYFAYADLNPDKGSLRETFFITALRLARLDFYVHQGCADFVCGSYSFEVGGPKKNKRQIYGEKNSYVVQDIAEVPSDPMLVPMWAFGFIAPR